MNAAVIAGGGAGHLPGGDGRCRRPTRHAAARPDPAAADVRRGAARPSRSCRRCGCCSTTAPAPRRPAARRRRPLPGVRAVASPRFPVPGTTGAVVVPRPERHARRQRRRPGSGVDSYTSDANALPPTDYGGNTGTGGLWGNASQWSWNWQQNPPGTAVSYVSAPLTADTTVVGAGAVTCGSSRRRPTSTCRRRSARSAPTATRRSCRTAGSAPASASSPTDREQHLQAAEHAARADPDACWPPTCSRCRPGSSSRSSIPLYYQGHAYRAGSRIRVTIAAPNGTQPIWSFAETQPQGTAQRVDRVLAEHAVEPGAAGRAERDVPTGAAAVPEPAQRALPDRGAVHQPGRPALSRRGGPRLRGIGTKAY